MKRATLVLVSLAVLCALAVVAAVAWRQRAPQPPPEVATEEATPSQVTLVVDGSSEAAADTNPGTAARPLRTIARAAALAAGNNLRGVGTRIQVRPGVYRESVTLGQWRGQTSAPISFEGPATGTAALSGSDVWARWRRVRGTSLYRHAWPHRWGPTPLPATWAQSGMPEIVRRREMVFANGRLLRQVRTVADLARASRGGFAVDDANGRLTIRLPRGWRLSRTRVEVATRPLLLRIGGRSNVQVSNLTFRHAASPLQQPAVRVEHSSNVQITNARFVWNNWTGLGLNDASDVTVRSSVFDRNGSMGFSAWRVRTLRLEDTSNSYNTWRGRWGAWYGWENGMKLIGVHGAVLQRHTAVGNDSYGLWLDTDNRDIAVRDSRICDNRLAGVFLEASQGPITLDRTTVCRNAARGILVGNASEVTLSNSHVVDNGLAQLVFSGVQSGREVTDWESSQRLNVLSTGWTVQDNLFRAASGQLLVDNTWSAATWDAARQTFTWSRNTWQAAGDKPFRLLGTYRLGTLADWQSHTGLDGDSLER